MKKCSKCKEKKDESSFYKGISWCKECWSNQQKKYYQANKEKISARMRTYSKAKNQDKEKISVRRKMYNYGISAEEYYSMLKTQNGVCATCGRADKTMLSVDHDHVTGKVRGLLCRNCNSALGFVKDDPKILWKMIIYLKKHGGTNGVNSKN